MQPCNKRLNEEVRDLFLKGSAIKEDVIRRYSDFFKILFFIRVRGGQAVPGGQPRYRKSAGKTPTA